MDMDMDMDMDIDTDYTTLQQSELIEMIKKLKEENDKLKEENDNLKKIPKHGDKKLYQRYSIS